MDTPKEEREMWRLRSMDRALMASRLVQPEFYEKTEAAIKGQKRDSFWSVCKEAGITDDELVNHMWDIVVAARKVYTAQSPGIIW